MQKVKFVKLQVQVSPDFVPEIEVAAWEVPLIHIVHAATGPEGSDPTVTEISERLVTRTPPNAADEYKRLQDRYKRTTNEDGSPGPIVVAQVYGAFGVGQSRLRAAIEAATVEVEGQDEKTSPELVCDLV